MEQPWERRRELQKAEEHHSPKNKGKRRENREDRGGGRKHGVCCKRGGREREREIASKPEKKRGRGREIGKGGEKAWREKRERERR